MKLQTKIAHGDKCRDRVTGIEGVAICSTEWLNGCIRWTLAFASKDGDLKQETFDADQIEVLKAGVVPRPAHIAKLEAAHAEPVRQPLQRTGGGGRKDPTGHASPSR